MHRFVTGQRVCRPLAVRKLSSQQEENLLAKHLIKLRVILCCLLFIFVSNICVSCIKSMYIL